jgi:hypothetical protein
MLDIAMMFRIAFNPLSCDKKAIRQDVSTPRINHTLVSFTSVS